MVLRKKIQSLLFTQAGYGALAGLVLLGVMVSCGGGDTETDASTDGITSSDTSKADTAQNNDTGQQDTAPPEDTAQGDTAQQDTGSQDTGQDSPIDAKSDGGGLVDQGVSDAIKDINVADKG